MGIDIVEGTAYLIKLNKTRVYNQDITEIINKFRHIFYLEEFSSLVFVDNTIVQRYDYTKSLKPIGWEFISYCDKYCSNEIPENLGDILKYEFEKDSRKLIDVIVEHGWYQIGYISY